MSQPEPRGTAGHERPASLGDRHPPLLPAGLASARRAVHRLAACKPLREGFQEERRRCGFDRAGGSDGTRRRALRGRCCAALAAGRAGGLRRRRRRGTTSAAAASAAATHGGGRAERPAATEAPAGDVGAAEETTRRRGDQRAAEESTEARRGDAAPRAAPEAGIPGGLLPEELALWTYDTDSGMYVEAEGDATQPYTPNLRAPAEPITIAYDDGFGGIPFTVAIKQEPRAHRQRARQHRDRVLRRAVQAREGRHLRGAAVLEEPDFAIESNFQSGAAECGHAHLERRQDPRRQHRRVAPERHLLRRQQLRVRAHRRAGGRRVREVASGTARASGSCTARTRARARSRTCAARASSTACARSAPTRRTTRSTRSCSTPAPRTRPSRAPRTG